MLKSKTERVSWNLSLCKQPLNSVPRQEARSFCYSKALMKALSSYGHPLHPTNIMHRGKATRPSHMEAVLAVTMPQPQAQYP